MQLGAKICVGLMSAYLSDAGSSCVSLCTAARFSTSMKAHTQCAEEKDELSAKFRKADNAGTDFEQPFRTWFQFSVRGVTKGRTLTFNVKNMNAQGKLFRQGMSPVYRALPSKPEWERLAEPERAWLAGLAPSATAPLASAPLSPPR